MSASGSSISELKAPDETVNNAGDHGRRHGCGCRAKRRRIEETILLYSPSHPMDNNHFKLVRMMNKIMPNNMRQTLNANKRIAKKDKQILVY